MSTDLLLIKNELGRAVRRDLRLRRRRRKTIRLGALSFAALVALPAATVAAADELGLIDLGGGITAERVENVPEPAPGKILSQSGDWKAPKYSYRLRGVPSSDGAVAEVYIGSETPIAHGDVTIATGPASSRSRDPLRSGRTEPRSGR